MRLPSRVFRRPQRSPSRAASPASWLPFVAMALATAVSSSAFAAGMDPTPERLVLQPASGPTCQEIAANPQSGSKITCKPDNVAFRNMVSELGFAIAPTAFHPARTTGVGGFALTIEA